MEAPSANMSTLSRARQSLFMASGATYLSAHPPHSICGYVTVRIKLCNSLLLVPFLSHLQHFRTFSTRDTLFDVIH